MRRFQERRRTRDTEEANGSGHSSLTSPTQDLWGSHFSVPKKNTPISFHRFLKARGIFAVQGYGQVRQKRRGWTEGSWESKKAPEDTLPSLEGSRVKDEGRVGAYPGTAGVDGILQHHLLERALWAGPRCTHSSRVQVTATSWKVTATRRGKEEADSALGLRNESSARCIASDGARVTSGPWSRWGCWAEAGGHGFRHGRADLGKGGQEAAAKEVRKHSSLPADFRENGARGGEAGSPAHARRRTCPDVAGRPGDAAQAQRRTRPGWRLHAPNAHARRPGPRNPVLDVSKTRPHFSLQEIRARKTGPLEPPLYCPDLNSTGGDAECNGASPSFSFCC